ncbi:alpha/beta hydrolase [Synechocystis sp. FACHB-383]|uniref:alpha/beta fold hydrolase n=1 Tax=Synechocystis sp. FACHB-383 TaxID=2692864 RepID=UPI0016845C5C|nr:alpha/beta hydrolase [Synechocystis sp. FACHB-383]MBD2653618.1 alpha/beta hydrolase [Synechocystis sp. FACHB-383]
MPTLDLLGFPHHYQQSGSGQRGSAPSLIFVHGWLLSHHYWLPLMEMLSGQYSCVGYDLRGFGESQSPDRLHSNYDLEAYGRDLVALLEKLNIEQAWLVGHSLGGSVAIWAAHLCPERVKGVICVNAGGGIYLKEEFEKFRTAGERLLDFRPPWLGKLPLLDLAFSRLMVQKPLARKWGKQRLLDFLRADQQAARGSLLESTTEAAVHLLPKLVAELPQPMYFLAGQNDRVMELQYVKYLASFHSLFAQLGTNVLEIEDCGHFAMLEQLPVVADKLQQILATSL